MNPPTVEADGATPLDPDEARGLRLNIKTREALNIAEEENILRARLWATRSRLVKKALLNDATLRQVHKRMFSGVWAWAGTYRTSDKNLGIPWQQISPTLHQVCKNFEYQVNESKRDRDELAVDFHHQLVSIHPFPNGNGRHARFCADRLIENLGGEAFTWGRESLQKAGEARSRYLKALNAADAGDLEPLLAFARSGTNS